MVKYREQYPKKLVVYSNVEIFEKYCEFVNVNITIFVRLKSVENSVYRLAWSLVDIGGYMAHRLLFNPLTHTSSIINACHDCGHFDIFNVALHFCVACNPLKRQVVGCFNSYLLKHPIELGLRAHLSRFISSIKQSLLKACTTELIKLLHQAHQSIVVFWTIERCFNPTTRRSKQWVFKCLHESSA